MDSKFIITRERRVLRPGDYFAFCLRSPFIRRFDSYIGTTSFFTSIRYRNYDVNIPSSSFYSSAPIGYICKPR